MIPIVTPDEMRHIDASSLLSHDELVERAGSAVARSALRMLGGAYGRVVVVIAGKGSNGADGRVAARCLRSRGVHVRIIDATECPERIDGVVRSPIDLVVDAAYGTGFRGTWRPPGVGGIPVLAVDVPSGVDALTGETSGAVLQATRTVTFAALKPGLLAGEGRRLAGEVEVVGADEMGLGDGARATATAHLVERRDVAAWLPRRAATDHKWRHAVRVVAGSPGMEGAARLACAAALRSGAGMVHVTSPAGRLDNLPLEVVQRDLVQRDVDGHGDWAPVVLDDIDRFAAMVVGPGLGTGARASGSIDALLRACPIPVVVDGDGLDALGRLAAPGSGAGDGATASMPALMPARMPATVLATPHDGEYARLTGHRPGPDRFAAVRSLAARLGCTVLLKGPVTVVADPAGTALAVAEGDERLATAGTGDVLAGIAGALLAQGLDPLRAGAAAAWLHGRAGRTLPRHGMIASDVAGALPAAWAGIDEDG
ncbi:MAG: NAD(P)H-hydrate dehydratase [Ilumatobacteraceae bacterium]